MIIKIIIIIIETNKKYFTLIFLVNDMMQILLTMYFFGHDYDDITANDIITNVNVVDKSLCENDIKHENHD